MEIFNLVREEKKGHHVGLLHETYGREERTFSSKKKSTGSPPQKRAANLELVTKKGRAGEKEKGVASRRQ